MKIYTRGGDKGKSSLYNGERRSKADAVFCALGDTDELAAALGIASEFCAEDESLLRSQITWIQCRLLDIGSAIATPLTSTEDERKRKLTAFDPAEITRLENWIDEMEQGLPPLTNFVLYSGGRCSTFLHLARTVCRRAERSTTPLVHAGDTPDTVLQYLNRLSDYLFVAARHVAYAEGKPETAYSKGDTFLVAKPRKTL
ncbi:Adenosylcobalamin biosynthesis, ATP:cob(I)alamin adenosyltransferase-like protein [Pavlovales sp. CCMP2436]|nr:Adenosylcobalamin biosynthesis, ATP:cob(I)alamin adenosyltransferase-like protein [Pavlovales sp. CCMP2436]